MKLPNISAHKYQIKLLNLTNKFSYNSILLNCSFIDYLILQQCWLWRASTKTAGAFEKCKERIKEKRKATQVYHLLQSFWQINRFSFIDNLKLS